MLLHHTRHRYFEKSAGNSSTSCLEPTIHHVTLHSDSQGVRVNFNALHYMLVIYWFIGRSFCACNNVVSCILFFPLAQRIPWTTFAPLHFTPLHFTPLHFTPLQQGSIRQRQQDRNDAVAESIRTEYNYSHTIARKLDQESSTVTFWTGICDSMSVDRIGGDSTDEEDGAEDAIDPDAICAVYDPTTKVYSRFNRGEYGVV